MIYWAALLLAIVFEVAGTLCLKQSAIHSSAVYGVITFIFYLLTFALLWYAIKKLDISTAYAIWAGMGTALITVLGIWIFNEQFSWLKLFFISSIVFGVVGLKLSSQ